MQETNRPYRRSVALGITAMALLLAPAPLLPPHFLAELAQRGFRIPWKAAYLVAALGWQVAFYGSLGILAALSCTRAGDWRRRIVQVIAVPLMVIALSLCIRSLRMGHLPVWINAAVPFCACLLGAWLGLGWLYKRGNLTALAAVVILISALGGSLAISSTRFRRDTEAHLRRLVNARASLATGGARFGALLQVCFAPSDAAGGSALEDNRAAILAWGISVGHYRLARLAGLDPRSELVQQAWATGRGATLRGRPDWAQHYAVSAALAVVEHPLISDAGGLMKEQLDALTRGSGFSFGDLAADRAGVRFAAAATRSEEAAKAMQLRLQKGYTEDEYFPAADFPRDLTLEEFRREFGSVGSPRYRSQLSRLEAQLDTCAALSPR